VSFGVFINVEGDQQVGQVLGRLMLDSDERRAMYDEIGISLSENARLRFGDQQAPDGTPWKPSIRAQKQGGETLRDTGVLMASITHRVVEDGVEYGTNVPYAPFLHFGAHIKPVNSPYLVFKIPGGGWVRKKSVELPARPILGISADDEESIAEIIQRFMGV
jgi:phage virion morphogenesis protein